MIKHAHTPEDEKVQTGTPDAALTTLARLLGRQAAREDFELQRASAGAAVRSETPGILDEDRDPSIYTGIHVAIHDDRKEAGNGAEVSAPDQFGKEALARIAPTVPVTQQQVLKNPAYSRTDRADPLRLSPTKDTTNRRPCR